MRSTITLSSLILAATWVAAQSPPSFTPTTISAHFLEQFSDPDIPNWSASKATKEEKAGEVFSYVGKWSVEAPTVYPGITDDTGLVLKSKAAHHAISAPFDSSLDPKMKTLVVQYEVKLQKGLDCGGAYIKLLTDSDIGIQAEEFSDKTPYTIMFGPDRCGATSKVHFIFRHKNLISGEIEEKHLMSPPSPKTGKTTTLYTLIVRPDQTYEIKIDNVSSKTGSLLTDFSPPVNPPAEIDDPTDFKPDDWVDSPKITDPDAVKPEDWDEDAPQTILDEEAERPEGWLADEEQMVPDPDAEKPEEWSDDDDGEWIAPLVPNPLCADAPGCGAWTRPSISNPEYKGKWFAPLIDNPEYKGNWAAKKIPNPDYFEDISPADFNKIAGVGFELWSMTEDILLDNIYIGTSESDAEAFAAETFLIKKPIEEALEKADAPKSNADSMATPEPDYRAEPVQWLKWKWDHFIMLATMSPSHAFKTMPGTGAGVVAVFATLVGMLGVFFSMLLPTKKTIKKTKAAVAKKTDAVTADVKDAAEAIKDAPIAEKAEEVKEGIKTRAGKGKAVEK